MWRSVLQDQQTRPNLTAISTLFLALIAVSFAPIFIRFSETELGANATVFNRFAIFVLCFGSIRWGRQRVSSAASVDSSSDSSSDSTDTPAPLTIRQRLWLVGVGLSSVSSLVLWAMSLEHTTVAKCMLLNNLTPLFTSLGSWLLLGKRFDKQFLIGMAIALVGAIALGLEDLAGS